MDKEKYEGLKTIGIIVPIYMEEKVIYAFYYRLINVINQLPYNCTVYYINDGSTDFSERMLEEIAKHDGRIKVIEFSRNFGHQAALAAGFDLAQEDVVISLDGDGQHPTELIPELINLYKQGYDIVQTQRISGAENLVKRTSSHLFYFLMKKMSNISVIEGTADFRLLSHSAILALKQMPEYHKFFRGMIPWIGFPTIILPYKPLDRIAGESKYSLRKMVKLAADAIFSFSMTPMKMTIGFGSIYLFLALFEIIFVASRVLSNRTDLLAPGWPTLMLAILLGNALILINLGILGFYVGYIFQQVKNRPIYIIRSIFSKDNDAENNIKE